MALLVLGIGCERDQELVSPAQKKLSPEEATQIFFKTYKSGIDEFNDSVVNSIGKQDIPNSIAMQVVEKYGEPLWNVNESFATKGSNVFILPIKVNEHDSLSAFLIFTKKNGKTRAVLYKNGVNYSKMMHLDEMFVHYQSSLFPGYKFRNIMTKPIGHGKGIQKEWYLVEKCWDVWTLYGNGNMEYRYSWCNYSMAWENESSGDTIWESGGGSGDTGDNGTGETGGTETTVVVQDVLNPQQINTLNNVKTQLEND